MQQPAQHSTKKPLLSPMFVGISFIGFFILVFSVFGHAVTFDFSMLDDQFLVVNNLAIRGITPDHLHTIFTTFDPELYIPLTLLSYQINYLFSGLDASFYHLTNIVLHAANAVLVTCLLTLFLRRKWIAVLCGIFFAVHPLHTEAVVWVAGRKDVLSTFFFLGSWITYIYSQNTESNSERSNGARRRFSQQHALYLLSIFLFLCALLSKAMILLFPLILVAQAVLIDRKYHLKNLLPIIPFGLLSVTLGFVALFGKTRIIASSTLLQTGLMAAKSTVFYLQKLIIPTNLNVFYAYQKPISIASSDFFVPVLIILAIAIGIAASLKWTKRVLFCAIFFILTLAPTFLNFHKGLQMFFAVDRYAYVPSIAFLLLIGFGVRSLEIMNEKLYEYRTHRRIISGLTIFVFVASLCTLSYYQTDYWQTNETLFSHALAVYPDSVPARINLSVIYRENGDTDSQRKVLEDGLRYIQDQAFYLALGSIESTAKNYTKAHELFEKARQADPTTPEPDFYEASLAEDQNNLPLAETLYKAAIAKDDSYVAAHNNLGHLYYDSDRYTLAEYEYKKALHYNENFMEGQYNLFQTLEMLRRYDEAFPHLEKAYQLSPDTPDILLSIGYRYQQRGRKEEARQVLEHLLSIEPDNRAAQRMLNTMIDQKK